MAVVSLAQAIRTTPLSASGVHVVGLVNGSEYADATAKIVDDIIGGAVHADVASAEVSVLPSFGPSKMDAVNAFIEMARERRSPLVVMDDDVMLPREALVECCQHLDSQSTKSILGFHKVALQMPICASAFQHKMHSFFSSSSLATLHGVARLPVRPTGSFYCLPIRRLEPFPSPCNEGEVLAWLGASLGRSSVATWYPETHSAETQRRAAQLDAHLSTPAPVEWKDRALLAALHDRTRWLQSIDSGRASEFRPASDAVYRVLQEVIRTRAPRGEPHNRPPPEARSDR